MPHSLCELILIVFVLTIPARTVIPSEIYRRPVVTAISSGPPPHKFVGPTRIELMNAPFGHAQTVIRRESDPTRPAWGCLGLITFFCLHTELNDSLLASQIWQLYVQDTPLVPVSVICLVLCVCKRLRTG